MRNNKITRHLIV